jgi:hypothetical protein
MEIELGLVDDEHGSIHFLPDSFGDGGDAPGFALVRGEDASKIETEGVWRLSMSEWVTVAHAILAFDIRRRMEEGS